MANRPGVPLAAYEIKNVIYNKAVAHPERYVGLSVNDLLENLLLAMAEQFPIKEQGCDEKDRYWLVAATKFNTGFGIRLQAHASLSLEIKVPFSPPSEGLTVYMRDPSIASKPWEHGDYLLEQMVLYPTDPYSVAGWMSIAQERYQNRRPLNLGDAFSTGLLDGLDTGYAKKVELDLKDVVVEILSDMGMKK
jgi:hypothetical protein